MRNIIITITISSGGGDGGDDDNHNNNNGKVRGTAVPVDAKETYEGTKI